MPKPPSISTPLKVAFCGTPEFSVPSLEVLHHHPHIEVVKVITMPGRPKGRGLKVISSPVAEFAQKNKISLVETPNINQEESLLKELTEVKVDLIIVLAFAQFLKKVVLDLPRLGCFNIHTSILPKYRGAAPIQYALLNDDSTTGVSIQKMVSKMDAGDVAYQKEIEIFPYENTALLNNRLKNLSALSVVEFIDQILYSQLDYKKQDESQVSFAPSIKKEDGLLDFNQESSQQIMNKMRAYSPWPSVYCYLGKKRMKILQIFPSTYQLKPGELHQEGGELHVGCQSGSLRLYKVQLEGKKPMLDTEFLRGILPISKFSIQPTDET